MIAPLLAQMAGVIMEVILELKSEPHARQHAMD
jgi:hypothetical protein